MTSTLTLTKEQTKEHSKEQTNLISNHNRREVKIYQFPLEITNEIANENNNVNKDLQKLKGNITQHFLDQCTKETARTYKTAILDFFQVKNTEEISLSSIQEISFSQIEEWLDRNKVKFRIVKGEKKYQSVSTMCKKCTSMSSLIEYINHLLLFLDSPQIRNPFKDKYLVGKIKKIFKFTLGGSIEIFSQEEIQKLFNTIENSNKIHKRRDYIMFKVLFNLGLRREELINITKNDIKEVDGEYMIKITKAKGNKQREVYLSDELYKMINVLLDDCQYDTSERIFKMTGDNVYKSLNSYCELAGIEKERIYTHLARHSFASIADSNGATLRDIQETLGHECHTTTSGYIHRANKFNKSASRMVSL